MIKVLAARVSELNRRLRDVAGERVEQRVFRLMLMLCHRFGPSLNMTRRELAEMVGATIETTIRILSSMKQEKIIRLESWEGSLSWTKPNFDASAKGSEETGTRDPFFASSSPWSKPQNGKIENFSFYDLNHKRKGTQWLITGSELGGWWCFLGRRLGCAMCRFSSRVSAGIRRSVDQEGSRSLHSFSTVPALCA